MSFFSKFMVFKLERAGEFEPHFERSERVERGAEFPDPTPMSPPIGYKKQPSIWQQQKELIRRIRLEEHDRGMETFEEADDFEVDDDFEPSTPFEKGFDLPEEPPMQKEPPKAAPPQPVAATPPPAVPEPVKAP